MTQVAVQNFGMKCLLDAEHMGTEIKEENETEFDQEVTEA